MTRKIEQILDDFIIKHSALEICRTDIIKAFNMIKESHKKNGLIMTCGNGGSATDAEHIVTELMKDFKCKRSIDFNESKDLELLYPLECRYFQRNLRKSIRAFSLTSQSALLLSITNDIDSNIIFAQQVFSYGREGDILIAISTSGNSENVINACKIAKYKKMGVIGLTGELENNMSKSCDVVIRVPAKEVDEIQDYHRPIYHILCFMLEMDIFN